MADPKIIQLIPAQGWVAVYIDANLGVFELHLCAWALVEEGNGERFIEGVTGDEDYPCLSSETQGLYCHILTEQITETKRQEWGEFLQKIQAIDKTPLDGKKEKTG